MLGGKNIFHPMSELRKCIGGSKVAEYLEIYLNNTLSATHFFVEKGYVDNDHMFDYSNFYARAFTPYERFTTRIHFFSEVTKAGDKSVFEQDGVFEQSLVDGDQTFFTRLRERYLGFIVVKPIKDRQDNPLVGRTVLRIPKEKTNEHIPNFLMPEQRLSLYGIDLKIEALPFQTQDNIVGACATTALWTALYPLNVLFGGQKRSPFEITKFATSFPGAGRNFPSSGLNIQQIKHYFNILGYETEFIELGGGEFSCNVVTEVARAYIPAGIPIIADIVLKINNEELYHAAVISGYSNEPNGNGKLYFHDDQIGPYCETEIMRDPICDKCNRTTGGFVFKNAWMGSGYTTKIERLIIPHHQEIRADFIYMYGLLTELRDDAEKRGEKGTYELRLLKVNEYKRFLLTQDIFEKHSKLARSWPQFLWVIRSGILGRTLSDNVYDATTPKPKKHFEKIVFRDFLQTP